MLIAFYVSLGCLLLVGLFFTLIHPLACIFDCATSKDKSGGAKLVWIVVTFLTGCLGSIAYTLLGTKTAWLRTTTLRAAGVGSLCGLSAIGLMYTSDDARGFVNGFADDESFQMAMQFPGMAEFDATMEEFEKEMEAFKAAGPDASELEAMQVETHSIETQVNSSTTDSLDADAATIPNPLEDFGSVLASEADEANIAFDSSDLAGVLANELSSDDLGSDDLGSGSEGWDAASESESSDTPDPKRLISTSNPGTEAASALGSILDSKPTSTNSSASLSTIAPESAAPRTVAKPRPAKVAAPNLIFNRYRNTSERIQFESPRPTVKNRYINQ